MHPRAEEDQGRLARPRLRDAGRGARASTVRAVRAGPAAPLALTVAAPSFCCPKLLYPAPEFSTFARGLRVLACPKRNTFFRRFAPNCSLFHRFAAPNGIHITSRRVRSKSKTSRGPCGPCENGSKPIDRSRKKTLLRYENRGKLDREGPQGRDESRKPGSGPQDRPGTPFAPLGDYPPGPGSSESFRSRLRGLFKRREGPRAHLEKVMPTEPGLRQTARRGQSHRPRHGRRQ